jgi:hypothetical protein
MNHFAMSKLWDDPSGSAADGREQDQSQRRLLQMNHDTGCCAASPEAGARASLARTHPVEEGERLSVGTEDTGLVIGNVEISAEHPDD